MDFEMLNSESTQSHQRIASITTSSAARRSRSADIASLQARVERQNMVLQTVLMLLVEKKVIGEQELKEWIDYVDGLDGRVDGKLAPDQRPVRCPTCGRNNSPRAAACQYCSSEFTTSVIDKRHKPS